MSPVMRAGLVFGLATVGAILGSSLLNLVVPLASCLGFLSVVALGLGAGFTAAKNSNAAREQRVGRGASAGAIAGVITLIGSVIVLLIISQLPAFQAQVQQGITQALQNNPNAANSGLDPAQLARFASGAGGVIGGFCSGLFYLVIMVITGLLGALFWKGAPAAEQYVPAGGTTTYGAPPTGTYGGPANPEGGARVYDPNDPNRPQ